jgi:hypothetical protein
MNVRRAILIGLLLVAPRAAAQETAVADYFAAADRARAALRRAGDSAMPEMKALHDPDLDGFNKCWQDRGET